MRLRGGRSGTGQLLIGLMALGGLLFLLPLAVAAQEKDLSWMISRYDALDNAINGGEGYAGQTNEQGTIAWAESYLLASYIDMYLATKDLKYIRKFLNQAEGVVNATDRARGAVDYRGLSLNGWGAAGYGTGGRMIHLVHSAVILHPLVTFALMSGTDPLLAPYAARARQFVELAEQAVREFEPQWVYNRETGEGTYRFLGDEPLAGNPKTMPLNAPLAMGRVILALHRLTGKEAYLDKARALGILFKGTLNRTAAGGYVWGYQPKGRSYSRPEDLSHGAVDVDFAVACYRQGIVFDRADILRFAVTLLSAKKGKSFATFIDGSNGKSETVYPDAAGRWLELAGVDCSVYPPVYDYITSKIATSQREHPQILLGLAKLIKYRGLCHAM